MATSEITDGGPAFPCEWDYINTNRAAANGMSKRDMFAAILMHGELVTCGVPGEAADALVEASRHAGTDVIEHMASNAVGGADALLRALAAEPVPQYRDLYPAEQARIDDAVRLAAAVEELAQAPGYAELPAHMRDALKRAADNVLDPEIPF